LTEKTPSPIPTLRNKVSTGYGRLDEALQGGFLNGSMVVLNAPASDEVPILLKNFLESDQPSLLICRNLSSAQTIAQNAAGGITCLVCSDKPVPPARGILPGKGIENLTDLNLQIIEAIGSVQPKRVALDILSDVLLRHKALQTRKWLNELLERLRSRGITALAILNPYMHASEETQAVVDLFDGNIEIFEKEAEGELGKLLRIKWVHGVEVSQRELPLEGLVAERTGPELQPTRPVAIREPRWLTPLVGREEELSKLKIALQDARAGKSSIVVIHGEAGSGKSRILRELTSFAQSEGAVVITGRGTEDKVPYAPWVELLREYVAQVPSEVLRRMIGGNPADLAKLVPDITVKLGTIPPVKSIGEQQDKIRLFETITQFLIAVSKERPLLVLLDDMEWADQASIDLLEYFVRSTGNLQVLTICGYRAEELEPDNALEKSLMKLNRERLLENISLRNLTLDETAKLVTEIFGESSVSVELMNLIHQRTGGNPFFVEEVLRSMVEDGTIYRSEKGWERKPIQELVIPKSVKAALESRIKKLDADTVNVAVVASVIGFEFDFDVLREVSGIEEDALLERLEKALASGLIEEPGKKGVFRFVDSRIRELMLGNLSKIRSGRYHQKIAEAMEKIYTKNLDEHAEAIANHCYEAGDAQRCMQYSIMAGDRNRSIHAYDQAVNDYKRALELLDLGGGRDEDKASVLEKLGGAYYFAGNAQESTVHYDEALALFEKLHDYKSCARICHDSSDAIYDAKGPVTGAKEAILVTRRALKYVESDPSSFEAASIYSRLAFWLGLVDEYEEAVSWIEKGLNAGEKSGNFTAIANGLASKGCYLADTGRVDEGLSFLEKSLQISLEHELFFQTIYCLLNLSFYTYPRDLAKAREFAIRRLELCERINHVTSQASAWLRLSEIDFRGGDWGTALDEIKKAFEILTRLVAVTFTKALAHTSRGFLLLGIGDLQKAEADFQQALELMKDDTKIGTIVPLHAGLGFLREEQGREEEARIHFETCVNAFRKREFTDQPVFHIQTLLHLTQIYVKHQELKEARTASEWAGRLAEQLRSDAGLALSAQANAVIHIASGEGKMAEESLAKSAALWEKAGWPYYHAKALVAYSEALTQTNPEESKKRLLQAAEIFMKLGAKRDLEKMQSRTSAQQGLA
jgi:tetratricopeptide (TPR) repeat protein/KaiC/GvpD/RAD55 family RecA-like ATPase/energy-coupling factor transporter ATP-binding protein EcfA2